MEEHTHTQETQLRKDGRIGRIHTHTHTHTHTQDGQSVCMTLEKSPT
jgi:hypothetical protein